MHPGVIVKKMPQTGGNGLAYLQRNIKLETNDFLMLRQSSEKGRKWVRSQRPRRRHRAGKNKNTKPVMWVTKQQLGIYTILPRLTYVGLALFLMSTWV